MEMPKPGPAHEKLARLAGVWMGKETLHPQPWAPEGSIADAWVENRIDLNGFIIVQSYRQQKDGETIFEGHGVLSWDQAANEYTMHWWDLSGMGPAVFRGNFGDGGLILVAPTPQGSLRATWDFSAPTTYKFKMEMSPDGQQWVPMMDGEYERA